MKQVRQRTVLRDDEVVGLLADDVVRVEGDFHRRVVELLHEVVQGCLGQRLILVEHSTYRKQRTRVQNGLFKEIVNIYPGTCTVKTYSHTGDH